MQVLEELANELMQDEFDGDTCLNSNQSILSWMRANIGVINGLLDQCYELDGPDMDEEAQAIYKQAYLYHYYSKKARNALRGIMDTSGGSEGEIASISDGESKVSFTNKNESAKVIRAFANDAKNTVDELVHKYNMYQSEPRQVSGIEG
tara:strand:+ start:8576 stop:9022 length:447 start_codon:yes stop_codon:yes gene_type:complete